MDDLDGSDDTRTLITMPAGVFKHSNSFPTSLLSSLEFQYTYEDSGLAHCMETGSPFLTWPQAESTWPLLPVQGLCINCCHAIPIPFLGHLSCSSQGFPIIESQMQDLSREIAILQERPPGEVTPCLQPYGGSSCVVDAPSPVLVSSIGGSKSQRKDNCPLETEPICHKIYTDSSRASTSDESHPSIQKQDADRTITAKSKDER